MQVQIINVVEQILGFLALELSQEIAVVSAIHYGAQVVVLRHSRKALRVLILEAVRQLKLLVQVYEWLRVQDGLQLLVDLGLLLLVGCEQLAEVLLVQLDSLGHESLLLDAVQWQELVLSFVFLEAGPRLWGSRRQDAVLLKNFFCVLATVSVVVDHLVDNASRYFHGLAADDFFSLFDQSSLAPSIDSVVRGHNQCVAVSRKYVHNFEIIILGARMRYLDFLRDLTVFLLVRALVNSDLPVGVAAPTVDLALGGERQRKDCSARYLCHGNGFVVESNFVEFFAL